MGRGVEQRIGYARPLEGEPDDRRDAPLTVIRGAAEPLQRAGARLPEATRADLLAALAKAGPGRVVTHRQLLSTVWGPAHVEDAQYLRVYIGHLRQKLGAAARLIRTEPGVGCRFGEPV